MCCADISVSDLNIDCVDRREKEEVNASAPCGRGGAVNDVILLLLKGVLAPIQVTNSRAFVCCVLLWLSLVTRGADLRRKVLG